MNQLNELKQRILKSENRTPEENLVRAFYLILRKFSLNLEELKNLPVPTFFMLINLIIEEHEESEKRNKKLNKLQNKK